MVRATNFLAGSALSGDENRGGAGSHHLDQVEDLLHFLRRTDQRTQHADVAQPAAAGLQFALGAAKAGRVLQDVAQSRGIDRLLDEVEGPTLHGGDGGVDSAHTGQKNHGDLLGSSGDMLQQFHTVHAGHLQIGDHDRGLPRLDLLPIPRRRRRRFRFRSPRPEPIRQAQSARSPRPRRLVLFPESFRITASRKQRTSRSGWQLAMLGLAIEVAPRLRVSLSPGPPERRRATSGFRKGNTLGLG